MIGGFMDQTKHNGKHGKQDKKITPKFINQRAAEKFEDSVDRFEASIKELESILKRYKAPKND
jgi:uncharacterized membrane protein